MFTPDNLGSINKLVLRRDTSFDDSRRKKQSINRSTLMKHHERFCQVVRTDRHPGSFSTSSSEWAVEAVPLTRSCQHRFENWFLAARCTHIADTFGKTAR